MGFFSSIGAAGMEDNKIVYDLEAYDYDLPAELIAQVPSPGRETSRMLVLNRSSGDLRHTCFRDLRTFLRKGDVLVINDTMVVPARLIGTKDTGGRIELLVTDPYKPEKTARTEGFRCLAKAAKHTRPGCLLSFDRGVRAEVLESYDNGTIRVRFHDSRPIMKLLDEIGKVPLPPYIRRDDDEVRVADAGDYQTVYARNPGAVAAPTAGLHFTEAMLTCLRESDGVEVAGITLHVGYGTFAPMRTPDIREHGMHSEHIEVGREAAERMRAAVSEKRRIIAVGTTVVRTLEWVALKHGGIVETCESCNHYIYPGYRFRIVDSMITNFHLPKSSLLLLVSAFAGRENILAAYAEAVARKYRFFSYGDCMLIL